MKNPSHYFIITALACFISSAVSDWNVAYKRRQKFKETVHTVPTLTKTNLVVKDLFGSFLNERSCGKTTIVAIPILFLYFGKQDVYV